MDRLETKQTRTPSQKLSKSKCPSMFRVNQVPFQGHLPYNFPLAMKTHTNDNSMWEGPPPKIYACLSMEIDIIYFEANII